jgi:hypothetical protein
MVERRERVSMHKIDVEVSARADSGLVFLAGVPVLPMYPTEARRLATALNTMATVAEGTAESSQRTHPNEEFTRGHPIFAKLEQKVDAILLKHRATLLKELGQPNQEDT